MGWLCFIFIYMEVLFYLNTNYIYIISSLSPHGECGLKYACGYTIAYHAGHSPHGECGLKYVDVGETVQPVTPHTGSVD